MCVTARMLRTMRSYGWARSTGEPPVCVRGARALHREVWYRVGMADATVGLADAIAALRKELLAAVAEGKDAAMRFRLAPVELSMQVAVTKDAEGKIGWHILGLGGSYSSAVTQTLALRLEPVWKQDGDSYTSDFAIADQRAESPRIGPRSPERGS
jgi:hypothetical protein